MPLLPLLLACTVDPPATPPVAATVAVHDAWTRPLPPGAPSGAVYLRLHNPGRADTAVVAATSPAAAAVELHAHQVQDGVARMRPVSTMPLPAGGQLELAPMGHHVMLIDLQQPVVEGGSLPLALVFDDGSTLDLRVSVQDEAPDG